MAHTNYLTHHEMLAVLAAAKKVSIRNWCLVLLGYRFGLRSQELASLTLENVKGDVLDIQRLKGSDRTTDPITSDSNPLLDAKAALHAYLRSRKDETTQFLFVNRFGYGMTRRAVYNIFEDAAFQAGMAPDRRNAHLMKHSLCVTMRLAGAPIEVIAKTVGHKDYNTTYRAYAHVARNECQTAVGNAFASAAL